MSRPTLLPHLRPLWRSRNALQLGTDPGGAVVVEFRDPAAARLLEMLDGRRTEAQLVTVAGRRGIGADQTQAVLATLRAAGVLTCADTLLPKGLPTEVRQRLLGEAAALARTPPAGAVRARQERAGAGVGPRRPGSGGYADVDARPRGTSPAQVLRRRTAARVLVGGPTQIVAPLACALAAAGVGRVAPDGPARAAAVAAIRLVAPEVETASPRSGEATFTVISGVPGARARIPGALRGATPYLAVSIRDTAVVVGPLAASADSACVDCLDLHRSDRDPDWPALAAQLAAGPDHSPCPATTVLAAAAYAAEEVLAHLDGRPARTVGATVEIAGPGQYRSRSWPPHPRCPCRPGRGAADRSAVRSGRAADRGTRRHG